VEFSSENLVERPSVLHFAGTLPWELSLMPSKMNKGTANCSAKSDQLVAKPNGRSTGSITGLQETQFTSDVTPSAPETQR